MANAPKRRLGEILVSSGALSEEELLRALDLQKLSSRKLGEILVGEGFITENQIIKVLEEQLGIKSIELKKYYIDPEAVNMIPEALTRKYEILGVEFINGRLVVAMHDPLDYFAIEDLKLTLNLPIKQVIASKQEINDAIERFFSVRSAAEAVEEFFQENATNLEKQISIEIQDDKDEINNAPIVKFINSVVENSIRNNASDIHIEPDEKGVRIRIRIDGVLRETMTTALETANSIVSRIKIMSGLNIAEKRVPQDGRITFNLDNRRIDLRVSTLPTTYGEKIVMRVMDKSSYYINKQRLGLSEHSMVLFDKMITRPHGIILVTGPTGSGKSSTLYAILNELNTVTKNIITLEDPVEYDLFGINQVQLNTKAGLSFSTGLRSILRQDPDIIMVGEIRDAETAEIAIRSALTGHLVLSTLHTNDAPGAISRVIDMGIEPFLISSSVIGVIAQRLVRKICPACMTTYTPDDRELRIISTKATDMVLKKGTGCRLCNNGYKGRTAVFEIMEVSREIRTLIDNRSTTDEIREVAIQQGMISLYDSCKQLVLDGVTTIDELARVTYTY